MLRKIGCSLLCACALYNTNALAMSYYLTPSSSFPYELPPSIPVEIINPSFWIITVSCTVFTDDKKNDILAEILNKQVRINGKTLSKDSSLLMTVYSGDKLDLSADPGSKTRLTNLGEHSILASCSTK